MTRGRGRPLLIAWRPEDDEGAFKAAYRTERRTDVRPRLPALWLLRGGRGVREVAQPVGVHERTLQRWVGWYREGGLPAVVGHRQAGRGQPAFLTAEQQAQLRDQAATGAFRTAPRPSSGSRSNSVSAIDRVGCTPPGPPAHSSEGPPSGESQGRPGRSGGLERRGLTDALTAAGVTREQTVGLGDELRLGLIGQMRRVWAPVGVKVVQPLQYERQWCYVLIVVDGRNGRLWWSWTLGMGAADLHPEVAKWHGAGIDAVVWYRAPAHQTLTRQFQDVPLILQPPYSPALNPAERVIEAIRQHIEGLVYASLPEKYAAVHAFLEDLDADPARVRTLAGWQWIDDALDALPATHDFAA